MYHILKLPLLILFLFCGESLFSQQILCVPFEIFNVQHTQDVLISEMEISDLDLSYSSLQLIALPESQVTTPLELNRIQKKSIKGIRILLINTTSKEIDLHNMDGRIVIDRQAYYKGKWVKVAPRRMHIRCLNSINRPMTFKPNETVNFLASCTQGGIKTQFRFVVYKRNKYGKNTPVYSNTFYGYLDRKYVQ